MAIALDFLTTQLSQGDVIAVDVYDPDIPQAPEVGYIGVVERMARQDGCVHIVVRGTYEGSACVFVVKLPDK